MASKRTATTELNHDNWNEEQEPEEAGTFTRATNAELKKRVLKTARRGCRLLPTEVSVFCYSYKLFTFNGKNCFAIVIKFVNLINIFLILIVSKYIYQSNSQTLP